MANPILEDRASSINSTFTPSSHLTAKADQVEDYLIKSQALVSVALQQGLVQCSESARYNYLSLLDDLLRSATESFEELRRF